MANTKEKDEFLMGNKAIAEFMGFRVYEKRYPRNHGIGGGTLVLKDCILEKLKFHTSWDWLMPVVEKIAEEYDICLDSTGLWVCSINRTEGPFNDREIASTGGCEPVILNVWYAVVRFLEWRNTKSKDRVKGNKTS